MGLVLVETNFSGKNFTAKAGVMVAEFDNSSGRTVRAQAFVLIEGIDAGAASTITDRGQIKKADDTTVRRDETTTFVQPEVSLTGLYIQLQPVLVPDGWEYEVVLKSDNANDTSLSGTCWIIDTQAGIDVRAVGGNTPLTAADIQSESEDALEINDLHLVADAAGRVELTSDGLNQISTTEPSGSPSGWNFREWLCWVFRRWSNKTILDGSAGTLKVRNDADDGDLTSQDATEVSGVQTITKAT